MGKVVGNEVHREMLTAIAREELGIHSLTETGKVTEDIRLVRVCSLADALERAYDFGLSMGHNVARAEHSRSTRRSGLNCRVEQDLVRSAADDVLRTTWPLNTGRG